MQPDFADLQNETITVGNTLYRVARSALDLYAYGVTRDRDAAYLGLFAVELNGPRFVCAGTDLGGAVDDAKESDLVHMGSLWAAAMSRAPAPRSK